MTENKNAIEDPLQQSPQEIKNNLGEDGAVCPTTDKMDCSDHSTNIVETHMSLAMRVSNLFSSSSTPSSSSSSAFSGSSSSPLTTTSTNRSTEFSHVAFQHRQHPHLLYQHSDQQHQQHLQHQSYHPQYSFYQPNTRIDDAAEGDYV